MHVRASVFQTPRQDEFQFLDDVVISVEAGRISAITSATSFNHGVDVTLPTNTMLIPGLVDLHIHAPQWPQLGTGLDLPLDQWLFDYTFPLESRCADPVYASEVWNNMVPSLLANGTTTAVYYSSIHVEATTALAQACIHHGQRAWVGRTAMDHPEGTPEYYRDESAAVGVAASRASIDAITALEDPRQLVRPIITPRFIPACTDELMEGLGQLAAETGHLTQTHCSENDWEHNHVLERCGVHDAFALDGFGLLRRSTVLAHGCLLSDDDFAVIAERGAGVAHCPLSNTYFGDAVFPARRALDAGVHVGLGTDIAGGPTASLLAESAGAVNVSRHLENGVDQTIPGDERGVDNSRIDAITAFYLATMGGAELLGAPVGLLEPGRRFDAVAVSMNDIDTVAGGDAPAQRFEKLVRLANRRNIKTVWVDGVQVSQN